MKKKIIIYLTLCSILVMLLCLSVGSVTTPTLSFIADSIDYETDTVKVNLYIENNPGITSMNLEVGYDSDAMTLIGAVDAGKLSDWASDSPSNADGSYHLVWEGDLLKNNILYNGLAATLTFDISSCPNGNYHVSLSYDNMNHDILNCNDKTVAFLARGCDIVVDVSNKLIYQDYTDHSELIGIKNCTADEITVPAEHNGKPVTVISAGAFFGCDILEKICFEGNAPSVAPADDANPSFPTDIILYYIKGTTGWTDSEYYDESAGTWNGYKLEKWIVPVASGYCGGDETTEFDVESDAYMNLTWTLYDDGRLVIDGTGKMKDYERKENSSGNGFITTAPWGDHIAKVESLKISDNVTSIGDYAFAFCEDIPGTLEIGKNITEIGEFAFASCKGFTGELKLPSTLKKVDQYALWFCTGLTGTLELPEGLTDIGQCAFDHCLGFTGKLIIPKSVENIGYCALTDMEGITGFVSRSASYKTIDGILYNSDATELIMCPCHKEGTLTIPDTVKTIGEWAFTSCIYLTGELKIPEGVTEIGLCAFHGCSGFTGELNLPGSLISIGNEAFFNCRSLTGEVTIPINVLSIGSYAFDMCDGITGFYFKGNAPAVDMYAFPTDIELSFLEGMSGWTDSVNYDTVSSTWNGYKARMIKLIESGYCGGDETAEYDSESEAYKNISWSIYENGLIRLIGHGEMKNYSVKEVDDRRITTAPWSKYSEVDLSAEIESNITKTGDYSFFGLNKLVSLEFIKINPVRKLMMLKASPKIGEVIIGKYSFSNCESLEHIELSDNVTEIEEYAFESCTALTGEIDLPENLVSIGKCAFKNVEKVEKINVPESVKEIEKDAFDGNDELTICAPKDSYAENWAKENSVDFQLKVENVSIFGKVTSYNPNNILTIELFKDGEVMYSAVIDDLSGSEKVTQEFTLNEITAGKYDLVVTKVGHLDYIVTDVVVTDEDIDLTASEKAYANMKMIAGDLDGDGKVNSTDWSILWNDANYLKSAAVAENKLADINGNGSINSSDWSILWSDANYLKKTENSTFAY